METRTNGTTGGWSKLKGDKKWHKRAGISEKEKYKDKAEEKERFDGRKKYKVYMILY